MTASEPTVVTAYLTVLVGAWTEALGPHLRALIETPASLPLPSPAERSHAVAVVAMSAFAIEAHAARLALHRQRQNEDLGSFLESLEEFADPLTLEVRELFVARNALVHTHIWKMTGTIGDGPFIPEAVEKMSGRTGAARLLSDDQRTTRRRGLNLVPEYVGYRDARLSLDILIEALDACAAADVRHMPSAADTTRVKLAEGVPTLRELASRHPIS